MEYRREIDGLRALAVIPVILFHSGFHLFRGGFVGVDIFFVISGYLITTIIFTEKTEGTFSLIGFYERRARRILPALFLVMLACLPFAWFWLLPQDLKNFSRGLVAVPAFISNFLFWRKSGYFEASAELNPLLHTWSLAVEEQYYLLFPIFLMVTWRFGKRWMLIFLGLIALVSLGVAQWASIAKPVFAFYMLPTRGWELMVGASISFYATNDKYYEIPRLVGEMAGAVGLALICFSIFYFDKDIPFPGFYALVPTLGAALIILFSTKKTFVGKLLGCNVAVGFGLISYSAYLWHQPLLAFARYKNAENLNETLLILISIATFMLAYISWRYIEIPFRDKVRFDRKKIFIFSITGSLLFVILGFLGSLNNGFEIRLNENQRRIARFEEYDYSKVFGKCFIGVEQAYTAFPSSCGQATGLNKKLIWGDSFAASLSMGYREKDDGIIQYTKGACPPFVGEIMPNRPFCFDSNNFVMRQIEVIQPDIVVLQAYWKAYESEANIKSSLQNTIQSIKKKSPKTRIVLIGSLPMWAPSLPLVALKNNISLDSEQYLYNSRFLEIESADSSLKKISELNEVEFYSILDRLCISTKCLAVVRYQNSYQLTSADTGHLTEAGSLFLADPLLKFLKKYKSIN